jgi:hypothetical protein
MIRSFSPIRPALAGLAVLAALGGCSPMTPGATPALDARFGEAVREARVRQTIDPQGSRNTNPVAGIDGAAAQNAMAEYHKSFQEPAPTFNVLGIGGAGAVSR